MYPYVSTVVAKAAVALTKSTASVKTVSDTPPGVRLIDQDANKHIKIKQVIVAGNPGPVTDTISEMLKKLGLSVYDAAEASKNHGRDFPLWEEATKLQQIGITYNRNDWDKFTGRYHALVGGPTNLVFDDLIKAYPEVPVIIVDGFNKSAFINAIACFASSKFKLFFNFIDPYFFGKISTFYDFAKQAYNPTVVDYTTIIPEKKILHLSEVTDWNTICCFLGKPIPTEPLPVAKGDTIIRERVARISHLVATYTHAIVLGLVLVLMSTCVGLASYLVSSPFVKPSTARRIGYATSTMFTALLVFIYGRGTENATPDTQALLPVAAPPKSPTTSVQYNSFNNAHSQRGSLPPHLRAKADPPKNLTAPVQQSSPPVKQQSRPGKLAPRSSKQSSRPASQPYRQGKQPPRQGKQPSRPVTRPAVPTTTPREGLWGNNFEARIKQNDVTVTTAAKERAEEFAVKEVVFKMTYKNGTSKVSEKVAVVSGTSTDSENTGRKLVSLPPHLRNKSK